MEGYETTVGELAHRVVAEIARLGRAHEITELTDYAWAYAGELVRGRPELGRRTRAARIVIAGAAATYARYFLPPSSWSLAGVEVEIEDGRLDLLWVTDDEAVVFDELKLAGASGRPAGDGPTQRQVARYLAHGTATHGERFAGVRLVLLGAPRQSMLVGPGARLRRLADSAFWFEEVAA